jgi:hypothetical protein
VWFRTAEVEQHGCIEIGNQEMFGFIVRAFGEGGMTFEDDKPDTLAEAMAALEKVAGLPWCSIATLQSNAEKLHRIIGPAIRQPDQWALPILSLELGTGLADSESEAKNLRRGFGLEPASP